MAMQPALDTVRVSKNGNARTLTVPAPLAEREHIETGDTYVVQPVGNGDLLYRRAGNRRRSFFVGEGRDRAMMLADDDVMVAGRDPVRAPSIDWNF